MHAPSSQVSKLKSIVLGKLTLPAQGISNRIRFLNVRNKRAGSGAGGGSSRRRNEGRQDTAILQVVHNPWSLVDSHILLRWLSQCEQIVKKNIIGHAESGADRALVFTAKYFT